MRVCPKCGTENPGDALICVACDESLEEVAEAKTIVVDMDEGEQQVTVPEDFVTTDIEEQAGLLLVVEWDGKNRTMKLSNFNATYIVGRHDRSNKHTVDIDLQAVDGHAMGVSRLHARIMHIDTTWFIEDLDSSNGTYVNERKLEPGQPFVIRNGDHLRFGNLLIQVYYVKEV